MPALQIPEDNKDNSIESSASDSLTGSDLSHALLRTPLIVKVTQKSGP